MDFLGVNSQMSESRGRMFNHCIGFKMYDFTHAKVRCLSLMTKENDTNDSFSKRTMYMSKRTMLGKVLHAL